MFDLSEMQPISFDDLPVGQKWEPSGRSEAPPPRSSPRDRGPVEKRPFLKRGARMPLSKLPTDTSETVVEAIKNPPSKPRSKENDSNQTEDDMIFARSSSRTRPTSGKSRPAKVRPPFNNDIDVYGAPERVGPQVQQSSGRLPSSTRRPVANTSSTPAALVFAQKVVHTPPRSPVHPPEDFGFNFVRESDDSPRFGDDPGMASSSPPSLVHRASPPPPEDIYRRMKGAPPPETRKDSVGALLRGNQSSRIPDFRTPAAPPPQPPAELATKLAALDEQIEKFRRENEVCRKLRLERETLLGETERMKAQLTVAVERTNSELEEQRLSIKREKRALAEEKERQGKLLQQVKDGGSEVSKLRARVSELEAENKEKDRKFKGERDRLGGLVEGLQRRVAELEDELRVAGKLIASGSRQSTVLAAGPISSARSQSRPFGSSSDVFPLRSNVGASSDLRQSSSDMISETVGQDGRRDRVFRDGRREASFPSGLTKTVYLNGAALVWFPNGDRKETDASGLVTYSYASTGAVQVTHVDGTEIITFPTGQIEKHLPDGSKEITFPNGVFKSIPAA